MTKAELYKKACMLPLLPGVYIIRDKSGTIIYIGKAKRLRIRVSQYFQSPHPEVQHPAQGRQGLQLYQGDKGRVAAAVVHAAKRG